MPKKTKNNARAKIIEVALELAARKRWENVSMAEIAKKAGVSASALAREFEDKGDIVAGFMRMVDDRVLDAAGEGDDRASPRERLFDILMERFDILNERREGVVSILESFKRDPKQGLMTLPHLCKSMNAMMGAAGLDADDPCGALRVAGLSVVYVKSLKTWAEDDSPDLSKTMAALDKALAAAERLASLLGF